MPEDRELDKYLQGDSPLSRAYSSQRQEQPPPELDERILAAARNSVRPRRRAAHSPFASNWMVPASLAAVLVLAIGLIVLLPEEAVMKRPSPTAVPTPLADEAGKQERAPMATSEAMPGDMSPARKDDAPLTPPAETKARVAAPFKAQEMEPQQATSGRRERAEEAPTAPSPAPTTVEAQLQHIRQLLAAGQNAEAQQALDALRDEHPDLRLDADLQAQLERAGILTE